MEEQVEKVKTATGIQLPSYYNPIAVNPTKYAEQIQKRRLLWGNKDKQPVNILFHRTFNYLFEHFNVLTSYLTTAGQTSRRNHRGGCQTSRSQR